MDILWSPWRSKYIEAFKEEDKKEGSDLCFLCEAINDAEPGESNLVVEVREKCFAILNKFPYNNGHLLVAPNKHIAELEDLSEEELVSMMKLVRDGMSVIREAYKPHGFNVGINIGRVSGAGVPGHIHIHIVPRWNGDTSYMATLADVKIVSTAIFDTQKLFSELFKKLKNN
jgi:ATP adenylyltransferase